MYMSTYTHIHVHDIHDVHVHMIYIYLISSSERCVVTEEILYHSLDISLHNAKQNKQIKIVPIVYLLFISYKSDLSIKKGPWFTYALITIITHLRDIL